LKIGASIGSNDSLPAEVFPKDVFLEISDFVSPAKIEHCEDVIKAFAGKYKGYNILCLQGPVRDIKPEADDPDILEITKRRYKSLIRSASNHGIPYVLFFTTYDNLVKFKFYTDMWLSNNKRFWTEIVKYAEDNSVICLYCNVWDDEPYLLKELFEYINSDSFKFAFDIGHANYISTSPLSYWINSLSKYISYVLIHDNNGDSDSHLAIGEGNIPLQSVINELENKCSRVKYCIQLFDNKHLVESIKLLNDYLNSAMQDHA
jgi:sugar phosphate isomerase/epimerase